MKIKNRKKWSDEDDYKLIGLAKKFNEKNWKEISNNFQNKNPLQCFSRYKRIRPGIIKGSWTKEEDDQIIYLVKIYGKAWSKISKILISRNGKQIRDRFINVLDPMIKKGKFSEEEDRQLIDLYYKYGPRWSTISKFFPNRTADMIKNRFHSSIKRIISKNATNMSIKSNTENNSKEELGSLILPNLTNKSKLQLDTIQIQLDFNNNNIQETACFSGSNTTNSSPCNNNNNVNIINYNTKINDNSYYNSNINQGSMNLLCDDVNLFNTEVNSSNNDIIFDNSLDLYNTDIFFNF